MTSAWAVVTAALGASALTGIIAFGLAAAASRRERLSAERDARYEAYISVMRAASGLALLGQTLGFAVPFRSGISEGVNVTFGIRKPIDPLELGERFELAAAPLLDASARVWVHGTQRAIDAANRLTNEAADFLATATASDVNARGVAARIRAVVRGARRTDEQEQGFAAALDSLMTARAEFIAVVRDELGGPQVDLGFRAGATRTPAMP